MNKGECKLGHIHSVYDTDTHFKIDAVTRAVKNTPETKVMIVQHDHNSERFTFEIPRHVDGHDMSTCNVVQVHYINTDSTGKGNHYSGVYEVDDLQISPDSDDVVICSWLISANATQFVGKLSFVIRFACTTGEVVDYAWNTVINSNVHVSSGINNGEEIEMEYADILAAWEERIQTLENGGVGVDLTNAINNALAQAKESGMFDGADGEDGKDGVGISNVIMSTSASDPKYHTITIELTDGKRRTFSYRDGNDGVDGKDGADGYTPVKGEDYFDGEDGNGIKSAVLNEDYTLTLTFDDGTSYTTPSIRGEKGEDATDKPCVYVLGEGETIEDAPDYASLVVDIGGTDDSTIIPPVTEDPGYSGGSGGINITGASVGQTIRISEVDEDGVPTAWESVDFPTDDHINSLINTALGVIENGSY